jgi:hypothetical protein
VRVARLAAAGLLVLGLGACSATNEVTTSTPYALSDGVRTTLGPVTAVNLLVVAAAKGDPGVLSGALTNSSTRDLAITFTLADATPGKTVVVPAGRTVYIGTGTDQGAVVEFDAVPVAPGQVVGLTLTGDSTGGATVQAPVLDGTLPQYATMVPSPLDTTTAQPTPSPTSS